LNKVKRVLKINHIELREANEFVALHHRHHKPVQGHRFSIGCHDGDKIVGIAIVGRPVARAIDQYNTVEVTRLCTDGTKNACSMLYAACRRAARELGYKRIITYILESEDGTSLKAAGWDFAYISKGHTWNTPSRLRVDKHPTCDKKLYESVLSN